jgi:outer membrane protein TolC
MQLAEARFRTGLDTDDAVQQATAELEAAAKRDAGAREALVLSPDLLARLMGEGPVTAWRSSTICGRRPRPRFRQAPT